MPFSPGDIISYMQMCQEWQSSLQRGMNFRLREGYSLLLMSRRRNAPYKDAIENEGRTLIYEGHDVSRTEATPNPKTLDQPLETPAGKPTQNALFARAAVAFVEGKRDAELVAVYEKIHAGVWAFNGVFRLVGSAVKHDGHRNVFKFKLELTDSLLFSTPTPEQSLAHNRLIPSSVKLEVWSRDKGQCVLCGAKDNLHFDHDIPYSRGGTSLDAKNIRLLCLRHNLAKRDHIE